MRDLTEKLRRLSEMTIPEVRFRAAQKIRIAREQWELSRPQVRSKGRPWFQYWDPERILEPGLHAALKRRSDAIALLPGYFQEQRPSRFFWGQASGEKIAAAHAQLLPHRAEQISHEADAICRHRFRIFGYPEIRCGEEIPWRRDLVNRIESGLEHYALIPYLDFNRVGDSKIVWELNRHQHFLTLCQAYLLTRCEEYAEECLKQWEHWEVHNPYLRGINWSSSLEVAFRSWSWLWVLHLLSGSRALTGRRIAGMTVGLARSAEFIAMNLSTYFSPNTHLLGEGFALFAIGILLPELAGSEKWYQLGRTILLQEMKHQVRDDGSHFEQSTYYHRYAVEFFLCAAILAERNGCSFPEFYMARLARMVEFLQALSLPGGRDAMIGDADGGRLIAFGTNDPNDWRPILSLAGLYFGRCDFLSNTSKDVLEPSLWILGPRVSAEVAKLEPVAPPETSRTFADAGLVAMRSDWSGQARVLVFDAGAQGVSVSAHGHADTLGFICSEGATNWLVDSGTYVYTASRSWRDFFRSTRAHNTVVVDGQDPSNAVNFFKWRALPSVTLERSVSTASLDYAVGSHDGYTRLASPVLHRRRVIFVKPEYWIITDELTGQGTHELEFLFHFAPGVTLAKHDDLWLASRGRQKLLLASAVPGVSFRLIVGQESPIQGWYSENYGHRQPAAVLSGCIQTTLPVRFDWLLMPAPWGTARLGSCEFGGLSWGVETELWSDFLFRGEPNSRTADGAIATDADLALVRRQKGGELSRISLVNGSWIEIAGARILEAEERVSELSVNWTAGSVSTQISPPTRFHLNPPFTKGALTSKQERALRVEN